jgi:hypothetical protein
MATVLYGRAFIRRDPTREPTLIAGLRAGYQGVLHFVTSDFFVVVSHQVSPPPPLVGGRGERG